MTTTNATKRIDRDELREIWDFHGRDAWEAYKALVGRQYADTESFEDHYHGAWDSELAYAEDLVESCGMLEKMPTNLQYYFDYESFARDLFMSDYSYQDGHVFSNH